MRSISLVILLSTLSTSVRAQEEPRLDPSRDRVLFDGETLEGWVTSGGRYDGNAVWGVEQGAIVGRQRDDRAGGLLYTRDSYRNFVFTIETKIDHPFDSGVFVRMVPKPGGRGAQVTLDDRPGGEIGAIYSDEFLAHCSEAESHWKRDDWNRVTVRCVGPYFHLTAWVNGHQVMDYALPEGTHGFARDGKIGIQVHGGENVALETSARFRSILIRELPDFHPADFLVDDQGFLRTTESGAAAGWRSLFNGKDLEGWEPVGVAPTAFSIEAGILGFPSGGGDGYLRTKEDFRDFDLRLDFAQEFMTNSGVFLRANRVQGNPAFSGAEIQILDDFHWEEVTGSKLKPWQFTGSLYGSVAPAVRALRPNGKWNTFEISYQGSRLHTRLNGETLYDVDTLNVPADAPFAARAHTGFIGLQRHAPSEVRDPVYARFRNVFVRPR